MMRKEMSVLENKFTIGDHASKLNVSAGTKPPCILIAHLCTEVCTGHFTLGVINVINRFRELNRMPSCKFNERIVNNQSKK